MDKDRPSSTPEKQLLKLIEEPESAGLKQSRTLRRSIGFFSFGAIKGRILFFKEKTKGYLAPKKGPISIKGINKILAFCTFILVIYLLADVVGSITTLDETSALTVDFTPPGARDEIGPEVTSLLKKGPYYSEKVRSRDIFKFAARAPKVSKESSKAPSKKTEKKISEIVELVKDLKLVGISWSDDPDIMIEDTKDNMTYFLKRGQTIKKMKVVGVFKDKIILRYKEEEVELE